MMPLAKDTGLERLDAYKAYTEGLPQTFCNCKKTTTDHVELAYCMSISTYANPDTNLYSENIQALRFDGAGASTGSDCEGLFIAWADERIESVRELVHVFGRNEVPPQVDRSRRNFYELKFVTAKCEQSKDEDDMLQLGKAAVPITARCSTTTSFRIPAGGEPGDMPSNMPAIVRQAWGRCTARYFPYVRLKQALRLLGVVDKQTQHRLLDWLRQQNRLEWSQMLRHPWEVAHLELLAGRWVMGTDQGRRNVGRSACGRDERK
ncbi:hypothetical protein J7T55_000115 [Diaporthe amygdali]|uniref:uncharacterized protein n=1 Tax=Phomopsis amygdali TaxID=1214568 RepID=UPI0022FE9CB1|nr:uncharacterized protein J7T55_000115 [Diaporthe amygdali]KAJ0100756.1 hypothetical protein J7T55_000115 [Diaporthe amygdali]